jgi:hypothetical protein
MNLLQKFLFLTSIIVHTYTSTPVIAQEYKPIDSTKWEKAVEGLDYTDTPPEEIQHDFTKTSIDKKVHDFWQIALYIGVIVLLVLIILFIFGKSIFSKTAPLNKRLTHTIQDLDERPMETDLERFLREAHASRNYRLAIRIYYLMILQLLHEKGIIEWKKHKTNRDYVLETSGESYHHLFRKNTDMFEYVWYGESDLEETQYQLLYPTFLHLITQLGKNPPLEK